MSVAIDPEVIANAHDLLHKGKLAEAHELIHKAMGIDNEAEQPLSPFVHLMGFEQAFRTACRKNGVQAMYVAYDRAAENPRIITGGDQRLCTWLDSTLRAASLPNTAAPMRLQAVDAMRRIAVLYYAWKMGDTVPTAQNTLAAIGELLEHEQPSVPAQEEGGSDV